MYKLKSILLIAFLAPAKPCGCKVLYIYYLLFLNLSLTLHSLCLSEHYDVMEPITVSTTLLYFSHGLIHPLCLRLRDV